MVKEISFKHKDPFDLMVVCVHLIYFAQNNRNTITIRDLADSYPMNQFRNNLQDRLKIILQDFEKNDAVSTNDNFDTMELNKEILVNLTRIIANKIYDAYNIKQ